MASHANKFMSLLILLILSVSLLLTGCLGQSPSSSQVDEEPTPTPLPTTAALAKPTYTVERGEIVEELDFMARISPLVQEELAFRVDGFIKTIYVRPGDEVKTGDVLIELEGIDELERQARLNELDLRKVEINAEIAQIRYDMFLLDTPTWRYNYEQLLAIEQRELELAQIAVEEAALYGESLAESVATSRLLAPFDGQILYLNADEGDRVAAYDPIGMVADVSVLEANATLGDDVMEQLEEGMPVLIISGGNRQEVSLEGVIRYLPYPYGSSKPGEGTTNDGSARIELLQMPESVGLELADRVRVEVVIERHSDVLWLPPQAVRQFQGRNFVVVQDGELQRRVDVTLGVQTEDRWEILDGLEEGWIVVGP